MYSNEVVKLERNHIIPNFLTEGTITLFGATRETGKMTFVAEITEALETAGSFCGGKFKVNEKKKVLLVISKGDEWDLIDKIESYNPEINFPILVNRNRSPEEIRTMLRYEINNNHIQVVFFDSFSLLSSRDISNSNSNNEAIKMMDFYTRTLNKLNGSIIFTMHMNFRGNANNGIRGASGFEDMSSYVYTESESKMVQRIVKKSELIKTLSANEKNFSRKYKSAMGIVFVIKVENKQNFL